MLLAMSVLQHGCTTSSRWKLGCRGPVGRERLAMLASRIGLTPAYMMAVRVACTI